MSIRGAFDYLLSLHGRTMTLSRPGTALTGSVKASPGNYFRNMAGPDAITMEGREFVLSKTNLDSIQFPIPKRGDRLSDPELGVSVMSEVREMYDVGGAIIGYRCRCS